MPLRDSLRSLTWKPLLLSNMLGYRILNHQVPKRFVLDDVPYFAQWESRELVMSILRRSTKAEDDPNWKASGATSRLEYASWSWTGCGMACLKMILAHRYGKELPLVTLGKQCAAYGGYDMPLEESVGLKYKPFAQFVKIEFDIPTKPVVPLVRSRIIHELAQQKYVIASVSPMIRDVATRPTSKGGHLVLVVGTT